MTTPKNQTAEEYIKQIRKDYPNEILDTSAVKADYKAGQRSIQPEVDALKAQIAEKDKEIKRITKIANNNAKSCEGLSQEIDRLRDDLTAAHSRIEKLREALEFYKMANKVHPDANRVQYKYKGDWYDIDDSVALSALAQDEKESV